MEEDEQSILRIVTEIRTVQLRVTEPLLKKIDAAIYDQKEGLIVKVDRHENSIKDLNRLRWMITTLIITAVIGGILKLVIH